MGRIFDKLRLLFSRAWNFQIAAMKNTCPACGKDNLPIASQCIGCGQRL